MIRLYQNSLSSLPTDFGNLDNLEQLSLYQNNLRYLPKSFSKLQKLKKLNLAWNDFTEFPKEVIEIKSLNWFCYFNNHTDVPDLKYIKKVVIDRLKDE